MLGALIVIVAVLSAVFSNDIICLAMAPVLIDVCLARRLDPVPFLLALACSANVGSALTLIGNPQNMLLGEKLQLSFSGYLLEAAVPVVLGLVVVWALIAWRSRGLWELESSEPATAAVPPHPEPPPPADRSGDRRHALRLRRNNATVRPKCGEWLLLPADRQCCPDCLRGGRDDRPPNKPAIVG